MSSRELMHIIFAMIMQSGGEFVVAAKRFDETYDGKALVADYIHEKDIYLLTMEDYDGTEDVH